MTREYTDKELVLSKQYKNLAKTLFIENPGDKLTQDQIVIRNKIYDLYKSMPLLLQAELAIQIHGLHDNIMGWIRECIPSPNKDYGKVSIPDVDEFRKEEDAKQYY